MKTPRKQTTENYIKEIRRNTRRIFSSEQKIQIVMEALRAEMSVAELCRKYSINESQFYKWNKEFLEAGKKRLSGDTTREATSDEVTELKKENQRLKRQATERSSHLSTGKLHALNDGGCARRRIAMLPKGSHPGGFRGGNNLGSNPRGPNSTKTGSTGSAVREGYPRRRLH